MIYVLFYTGVLEAINYSDKEKWGHSRIPIVPNGLQEKVNFM